MIIKVKVVPKAKIEKIEKLKDDYFKVYVKTPPEKGKANQRVLELIADYFKLKKHQLKIVFGKTSSRKIIELTGIK